MTDPGFPLDQSPDSPGRLYLSPPHLTGREREFLDEALASNWVAPAGPHLSAFEREFSALHGGGHAVAVSSGTAAIHLALALAGVGPGDRVLCSSFTFVASANPIRYLGAEPVFVDSERLSWNMDPALAEEAIVDQARRGTPVKAMVVVHLYGQSADLVALAAVAARHGVALVEDAAEALGATCAGRPTGTFGVSSAFSFNGNKIITTSGGGMVLTPSEEWARRARHLATQARDPAAWYQHSEQGYNYRLSNLLAGVGRAQLAVLADRVEARRANFEAYRTAFAGVQGLEFMPEAPWGRSTRWLSCLLVDPAAFGRTPEQIRRHLERDNIECRALWKPLHAQPLFRESPCYGGAVADDLFARGLCLPSGSNLTTADRRRVIESLARCLGVAAAA